MVFTYDSVKRLLEKSASKQNRWSKYASMVTLTHPQHMLAFRFACICKRRQGWWEGSVHNTSHQDQQQSNLLPLGHIKSPHGRTWKGENDDVQDNSMNSNEDCPRKEIVVFRTTRIIFLIGMIYCPLAIKRRDGGQKTGKLATWVITRVARMAYTVYRNRLLSVNVRRYSTRIVALTRQMTKKQLDSAARAVFFAKKKRRECVKLAMCTTMGGEIAGNKSKKDREIQSTLHNSQVPYMS